MIYNFGNMVVNNYMIPYESGWLLIDTGYAGGFPRFKRLLDKSGIDEKDIRYVFLTHAHDDHAGFLNEILSATDAKVILHPKAMFDAVANDDSIIPCTNAEAFLSHATVEA